MTRIVKGGTEAAMVQKTDVGETLVQKQLRLQLETRCAKIARELKTKMPAGQGFILFMFDFGEDGNMAYCSTAEREDAIASIKEWLSHVEAGP